MSILKKVNNEILLSFRIEVRCPIKTKTSENQFLCHGKNVLQFNFNSVYYLYEIF